MASLSISQAWEEAKARISADGRLMSVVAAALIALPTLISGVVSPNSSDADTSLLAAIVVLAAALLTIVGQLSIIRLAIGPAVSVGEAISHGARRMPIYVVAGILLACVLFVAMIPLALLLVAAGVPLDKDAISSSPLAMVLVTAFLLLILFIGTRFLMTSPVASEESAGPIAILRRSWNLTEGHFWRLFGFIITFFIGAGIAAMAISWATSFIAILLLGPVDPMSASALIVGLVDAAVSSVITVVLAVTLARIYVQLNGRPPAAVSVPTSGT